MWSLSLLCVLVFRAFCSVLEFFSVFCNWAGAKQFPVPASQWFIVAIYFCASSCGR